MQKSGSLSKNNSLRLTTQQSLRRLGLCSPTATGQHSSPIVFPEKRGKVKTSRRADTNVASEDLKKVKSEEHRIDIGDEQSDLLGHDVFSGKLALDKRKTSKSNDSQTSTETVSQDVVDAKLTRQALVWGSRMLHLDDVISVSYNIGLRHFTIHAYPIKKASCGLSCFIKTGRSRKDFRFLAASSEEAVQWVSGFADQQCYVNCLPHPMKQAADIVGGDFLFESHIKSKSPPKILVILNPRSGHGRSSKVFHGMVEPIFKLAGFKMEVVKTTSAGHAKNLASSVDFSTCPDGIVCVGGDGIVNEVLNGLLSRDNQKEAVSIPIGIIPAGSDNSLVWTVLGVRDPVSAAIAIVKGGLTATDVFAVEWIQTGVIHFGMTVSYFGFVSDVLELSEKYQKHFGPLRYLVAGFLKFLCLPKYSFEVEYLPASKEATDHEGKALAVQEIADLSDLYTNIMRRSTTDGIPRASSLSSIDSIMTPSRMSGGELDTTCSSTHASTEPSEYVRGLDPKSKRLSSGRSNVMAEPEVIHPQLPLSATPNWPRTRSKSKTDKGWSGLTATQDANRTSWGNAAINDKEDISSTMSDPGPIWDAEPKWDAEPNWDGENRIELPGPSEDVEAGVRREVVPSLQDKWTAVKGQFLGILVCNHACKTVQSSQVVAPNAEHDDNALDLLLVHGNGRLRLLRFFVLLQLGRHLSLPYVEYVKVKSVKIKPGKHTHNGCGIDGELFRDRGQIMSSLHPEQCRLIGRSPTSNK
ncbi:sphingoid long-chain bases kinase 1 [Diospyros lotus]|uniref:sphingoid long-chain bases kinase 1 n=1 Tax=Diospyros lotus TaxID=55363 RepID=UPI00224CEB24|nr:sphingoid long-chain bases kinase 1 [Diospyros lotus]XP_052199240.1 sphingoid long-chain bases kinase 1 [Diospyros lotus]